MSFNQSKKRKNKINNFIKRLFFGKGLKPRRIIAGKAKGIRMFIDPAFKFQRLIGADEKEIQSLFVQYTKQCDLFFDIGASDGYYSLLYKKYNPSGEAYLFDTGKQFTEIQKKHFDLNKIQSGYKSYTKYVADINDQQHITLDSFHLKENNVLIKIDVEGGEETVLKGAGDLLKENNCCLIIETHSKQLEDDCINFLKSIHYKTLIIKNAWWRFMLAERRPLKHNRWLAAQKQ